MEWLRGTHTIYLNGSDLCRLKIVPILIWSETSERILKNLFSDWNPCDYITWFTWLFLSNLQIWTIGKRFLSAELSYSGNQNYYWPLKWLSKEIIYFGRPHNYLSSVAFINCLEPWNWRIISLNRSPPHSKILFNTIFVITLFWTNCKDHYCASIPLLNLS